MREIKFRAWDRTKMLPLGVALKRELLGIDEKNYYLRSEYPDSVVLMQYTGLKDKNGNEIYEGDILRAMLSNPMGSFQETKCKVVWNEFRACFECEVKKIDDIAWSIGTTCEIIGNIYENEDLL